MTVLNLPKDDTKPTLHRLHTPNRNLPFDNLKLT